MDVIQDFSAETHPGKLVARTDEVQPEVLELYRQFKELQQRDAERHVVLNSAREVLSDLGYEVMELKTPPAGDEESAVGGVASVYFRAPEEGVIRLGCGLDSSMFSEFLRPNKGGGRARARRNRRRTGGPLREVVS